MTTDDSPIVRFGPCCFCGEDIGDADPDPCSVSVVTSKGKEQIWRCHSACFGAKLDLSHKELFGPVTSEFFQPETLLGGLVFCT
jgi:hypothetical protein